MENQENVQAESVQSLSGPVYKKIMVQYEDPISQDPITVDENHPLPVTMGGGGITIPGTITTIPSGTQTVAGTVTAITGGTQVVSGTVTASPTGTYTVAGTVTNVPSGTQTVAGTVTASPTGTYTVAGTVTNAPSGTQTVAITSVQQDAFGKMRVTMPTTLGDYHHVGGENPEMLLSVSGSGSGTAEVATSSYVLSVGTGNGDYAIHQSKMYHHYLPGKSQLVLKSFCCGVSRSNTVKRIGYFDDRNGVFFQQNGNGSLSIVFRSYVTGSAVDTVINQSDWNQNTCSASIAGTGVLPDGSNASNFGKFGTWTIDVTKTQLLFMDFQWLGVGRLRIGFVHDGNLIIAHEFYNSNYSSNVYWTQPSLPVRCEIRNTGVAVGTSSMKQICATVMSEGGYAETGLVNTIKSSLLGRTIQNGGDTLPLIAIRLKNSFNGDLVRGIVRALETGLIITNAPVYFELRRFDSHTSITGGTWVDFASDSIIEYNITATAYSGGVAISGNFLEAAATKNATTSGYLNNPSSNKRGFITQNYGSTQSEAYALCVTALGSTNNVNIDAYGSLQWSETK